MTDVIVKKCSQCGAGIQINENICGYCDSPYYVKDPYSLANVDKLGVQKYIAMYKNDTTEEASLSIGLCYIKLGLYDFAIKHYDKAISEAMDNSEIYYYQSIALLKGKRPFLTPLAVIKKIDEYLEVAQSLYPGNAKYYFAQAIIKADYYEKKMLRTNPTSADLVEEANSSGLTDLDRETAQKLMNVY